MGRQNGFRWLRLAASGDEYNQVKQRCGSMLNLPVVNRWAITYNLQPLTG